MTRTHDFEDVNAVLKSAVDAMGLTQHQRAARLLRQASQTIDQALSVIRNGDGLSLTDKEREILSLAGRGLGYSEIGSVMQVGPKTIEFKMALINQKLGVNSKIEAVIEGLRRGEITLQLEG